MSNPNGFFDCYNIIFDFSLLGDNESESLFLFHNEVVKDYIEKCFKIISSQPTDELIDLFIKQTYDINFLLYWLNRIFTFLDRVYMKEKHRGSLAENEMEFYKELYFNPIKDDIYKELGKLIKQDRNGNKETRNKIKSIMKILNALDIMEPQIAKEKKKGKNEVVWIPDKLNSNPNKYFTYIYQDEWFEKYFKEETIQFAKEKVEKEIIANSAIEFILSQLKYLEEEKERQNEYINEKFHDSLNKINYHYLFENVEKLVKMDNGIDFMLENRKKDELKKVYELLKLYEPSLNVLKATFGSFMKKKCEELKEKKVAKDGEEFNNFKNEIENLVIESFENDALFQDEKNKILSN